MTFFQFFSQSMLFSSRTEEKQQVINTARQIMNELQDVCNQNNYYEALLPYTSSAQPSSVKDRNTLDKVLQGMYGEELNGLYDKFAVSLELQKKGRFIQVKVLINPRTFKDVTAKTYGLISKKKGVENKCQK